MKAFFFDRPIEAVLARVQTPYSLFLNGPVTVIAIIGRHAARWSSTTAKSTTVSKQADLVGDRDATVNPAIPSRLNGRLCYIAALLIVIAFGAGDCSHAWAAAANTRIVATDIGFPEGTVFVGGELYFVDYLRSDVLRLASGKTEIVWHQPGCGANSLVETTGGLIVACFDSGTLVLISVDGKTISVIRHDQSGRPFESPNDLTTAKNGDVYFSASGNPETPGMIFFLQPNRGAIEIAADIRFANGVGLSPDGTTLYVAESDTGRILSFSIAADGSLTSQRDFIRLRDTIPGAKPDSLKIDRQGNLFNALYDGGGLAIVSADGKLLTVLAAPGDHHTNLALSPDDTTLYIAAVDDDTAVTFPGKIVRLSNPLGHQLRPP